MVGQIQKVLFLYLPLVAAASLLAGGIVSASLMLVSVNERIAEIGLRRAIGARAEDIRLQFLFETAATTLAGGLLGLVRGNIGADYGAARMHLEETTFWTAAMIGITASILIGLLSGVIPAMRAARLHPAEALR
jgi:putative ABC transport system permease protein